MNIQTWAGYILTVGGLIGIFVSFGIQKSEFDPRALTLAIVAILIAIVGISLLIQQPNDRSTRIKRTRKTSAKKRK